MHSQIGSFETAVEMEETESPSQCVVEKDENIGAEMEEEEEEGEEGEGEEEDNGVSEYEQTREKRIKENMERMQKLGIFDASLQLKSAVLGSKGVRKRKAVDFKSTSVREADVLPRPTRRSSRLQNVTAVSYAEGDGKKKDNSTRSPDIYLEVGSEPEVYTDDKLLGECHIDWTLFVDGYGKDGKRIYDPVNGKTCHQCRQKTLGYRTTCSNCNLVQGQFCGDCLYTRYGEHVLEANQNPDWVCPPCRGICNCSLCRKAKGWAPTGPLYRKISSLGYKSVAHYLFQTRSSVTNDGTKPQTKTPSKMELPLSDGAPSEKDNFGKVMVTGLTAHYSKKDSGRIQGKNEEKKDADINDVDGHTSDKSGIDPEVEDNDNAKKAVVEINAPVSRAPNSHLSSEVKNNPSKNSKLPAHNKNTNEDEIHPTKEIFAQETIACIKTPDKTSTRKRSRVTVTPSPDSIAGRLRLRRIGLVSIKAT